MKKNTFSLRTFLASLTVLLAIQVVPWAQSQWHYLPNAPVGVGRIEDVFFLNKQLGWCVSGGGTIHKTTDGGKNWQLMYSSSNYFRCVEFASEQVGYAGTLDGLFFRTQNGGSTWTNITPNISPNPPEAVCGISLVDSLYGYAVGQWHSPAFLLKTVDGGLSWTNQDMSVHANALVDVFFINRDTGFVAGKSPNGAVILYTTDGGTSWSKKFESGVPGQYVWKIQRVTPDFWVGSIQTFGGGRFVKSYDGGQTWVEYTAPVPDMQGIGFATPTHGWVGGYVQGFYETTDGGESWTFQNFGGGFNRFFFIDSTLAYASGLSVYKFSDPGSVQVQQPGFSQSVHDGFVVRYSPNPTSGSLKLEYELLGRDNICISILASDGAMLRMVYQGHCVPAGAHQLEVHCEDLPPGTYYLGIQRNHGLYAKPFVKQ